MDKETTYRLVFFGKPTITHHKTEKVDLIKLLTELGTRSIDIRLKSINATVDLQLGPNQSRLTATFKEHEEES